MDDIISHNGEYRRCEACGRGFRDRGQARCPHCGTKLYDKNEYTDLEKLIAKGV